VLDATSIVEKSSMIHCTTIATHTNVALRLNYFLTGTLISLACDASLAIAVLMASACHEIE
jgi:hypothetical protein